MVVGARSLLVTGSLVALGFGVLGWTTTGCSSDDAPAGAVSGSSGSPAGGAVRSDGGADALANDASLDTSDAGDGGGDGGTKRCLGDTVVTADGGDGGNDAGIDCASNATCSASCTRVLENYRVGVASEAAACIAAVPSCAGPGTLDVVLCVDNALARACPDPATVAFCAPLLTGCGWDPIDGGGPFTKVGCEAFASGLSAAGRDAFAACITGGTPGQCTSDIIACVDQIRQ